MENRLGEIVKAEGYQEMADGFSQALAMVKDAVRVEATIEAALVGLPATDWKVFSKEQG